MAICLLGQVPHALDGLGEGHLARSREAAQEGEAAAADPDALLRSLLLYVGLSPEQAGAPQKVPPGYIRMDQLAALVPVRPPTLNKLSLI